MSFSILRSRFANIYLGIATTWIVLGFLLSFVTRSYVVPKILLARSQELTALVSSQRDALIYNDNRPIRDELLREHIIALDQDFEEIRPSAAGDRQFLADLLDKCHWVSETVCTAATFTVLTSEAVTRSSPTFALFIRTSHFSEVHAVKLYELSGWLFLATILSFAAIAIRQQEKFLINRIHLLASSFKKIEDSLRSEGLPFSSTDVDELSSISIGIQRAVELLDRKSEEIERYKLAFESRTRIEQVATVATQVAHDIRFPLAALNAATRDLDLLPEDTRVLIHSATKRIQDVANGLLAKNREISDGERPGPAAEEMQTQMISTLTESIISEKRLQFMDTPVRLDFEDQAYYGLFALVQPIEFKRVLSNLINNAIESFNGDWRLKSASVDIDLIENETTVRILIADNGPGIPHEIINKLGARGESYGKSGGSGLGLYHARISVARWNGTFEIRSSTDGTTVEIALPRTKPPTWFVPKIRIYPGSTVNILDDDPSIHQIWKQRLKQFTPQNIITRHFYEPTDFVEATKKERQINAFASKALNLIDYELRGSSMTGLDVVSDLAIADTSILVTSRIEDQSILLACEKLNLGLLPKMFAGSVSIDADLVSVAAELPLLSEMND